MTYDVKELLSAINPSMLSYQEWVNVGMTTVSVKLDFIRSDVSEIKSGLRGMQEESKDTRERLIAVEQSAKQAHKRIDQMSGYRAKPPDTGGDS